MARQSTTPMAFPKTTRVDAGGLYTSGRAGKVVPVMFAPVLRGDSVSGTIGVDVDLAEMPKPLLNAAMLNVQTWFVPKLAHPQFAGHTDFMHSYQGEPIKTLGAADRSPPDFFFKLQAGSIAVVANSAIYKTLGLHLPATGTINTDLIDAYNLIHNFRQAAYSSRLPKRSYATESLALSTSLARAFWPTSRYTRVVPDYERALVVGDLALDVVSGDVTMTGQAQVKLGTTSGTARQIVRNRAKAGMSGIQDVALRGRDVVASGGAGMLTQLPNDEMGAVSLESAVFLDPNGTLYADMAGLTGSLSGEPITTTLANFDKARVLQSLAKARNAYSGNDATGFDNEDAIVAELMQGFNVPMEEFKRPWLLGSKQVAINFQERFSTDSEAMDVSVVQGRVSVNYNIVLPAQDVGGLIVSIIEVMPQRVYERQSDEFLSITEVSALPDAVRDSLVVEPVDDVLNRRVDAKHTQPVALYGYEPMNDVWNRESTRLGGVFYQATPGAQVTEQRNALWLPDVVDPAYTDDHFLSPENLPHNVFADTLGPAFEVTSRHSLTMVGLTQIGAPIYENNDDYAALTE